MLIQILQRHDGRVGRRRDEITHDAAFSLAAFTAGKLKVQTTDEAIASLRDFLIMSKIVVSNKLQNHNNQPSWRM